MKTVFHEGHVTGAFKIDSDRLANIFKACARAIHYFDTRSKSADWGIVMPRLLFSPEVEDAGKQPWFRLYEMLQSIGFSRRATANPEIFEYGSADLDGQRLYCFVFYGVFVVYALPLPEGFSPQSILTQAEATS
jgi:hypothetical protein